MSSPIERWAADPMTQPHPEFFTHEGRRFVDAVVKLDGTDPGLIFREARLSLDKARQLHAWLGTVLYDGDDLVKRVEARLSTAVMMSTAVMGVVLATEDVRALLAMAAGPAIAYVRGYQAGVQSQDARLTLRAVDAEQSVRELRDSLTAARNEATEARHDHDVQVERLKACEDIALGTEGWEKVREECPSTRAVANLRDGYRQRCLEAGTWQQRLDAQSKSLTMAYDSLNRLARAVHAAINAAHPDVANAVMRGALVPAEQWGALLIAAGRRPKTETREHQDDGEQATKAREADLEGYHPAARALLHSAGAREAYRGSWPRARRLFVNGFAPLVDIVESAERAGLDPWSAVAGPLLELCRSYSKAVDDLAGYQAREFTYAPIVVPRSLHEAVHAPLRAEGLAGPEVAGATEAMVGARCTCPTGPSGGALRDLRAIEGCRVHGYHSQSVNDARDRLNGMAYPRWAYGPTSIHAKRMQPGYVIGPLNRDYGNLITPFLWAPTSEIAEAAMRAHNGPETGPTDWRALEGKPVLVLTPGSDMPRNGWVHQVTAGGYVGIAIGPTVDWFRPGDGNALKLVEVLAK